MKFQIPDKLKSRKFQAFLAVLLSSLGGYLGGDLNADKALLAVVSASVAYIAVEGSIDRARVTK